MAHRGIIAAGHPATVEAARAVLADGGNAFDAAIAALFAACVAEPVLASLGGGGFLLARRGQRTEAYDFFVQTPRLRRPLEDTDFHPIQADFGTATQEFHIGLGAAATPGLVRGLFQVHRDHASMPMRQLVEPALSLARDGVLWNDFQAHVFDIIGPIYRHRPETARHFASPSREAELLRAGDRFRAPEFADLLESLAIEGERLFYEGEVARSVADACASGGGHLSLEDLARYRVERRTPLSADYRGQRLYTNPPPSCGGVLIAFALALLSAADPHRMGFGSPAHLQLLATVMDASNRARLESRLRDLPADHQEAALLGGDLLSRYRREVMGRYASQRGTTHLSVIDAAGDAVSLTVSNGEGCGFLVPGTGMMLNNMLGEEDINPHGFQRWPLDQRMASMMAPTLLISTDGVITALGSGGSNRIRTAILQVVSNLLDFSMSVEDAVNSPRIHHEDELLNVEGEFPERTCQVLRERFSQHCLWPGRSLFFGGVHCVRSDHRRRRFEAAGDPRRGGASQVLG
jgi:gamma-glutamyltranspeptidase/glutathione hydrolase